MALRRELAEACGELGRSEIQQAESWERRATKPLSWSYSSRRRMWMGSLVSPAAAADSGEVDVILVRELGWGQGQPGRSFPPAWEMFFFLATHRTCRWMSYRRSGLTIEESRVLFDRVVFFLRNFNLLYLTKSE